ncbi:sensor histidine kinase [Kibdelosporangium aridum]|uniref:Histidine kinase-, DNA gyrase B-, and HSP90-like ATPase n=1 Tax=Kibdelosporangium aridum TaxID=2030 RepID=A0A1Y5Y207_KIBAR|nr:ATP-binding protein [Kibdelosporangium aridum]SMD24239.1 Histidine kinase-, DNA gyrase B-, and HSP90-like ATPase [Kibdelosporangium aridum]
MEILIAALAVGAAGVVAYVIGVRRGRAAERAELNRYIHDNVLQALEAMAMRTPSDSVDAEAKLTEFRNLARAQAIALRRGFDEPAVGGRLTEDLASVATDLARDGLRAQLVMADIDDQLPEARRKAVRDATREALRNTLKHAQTTQVTVRVEERDGGIVVTTRDHGVGFDTAQRPRGFGINQSIIARLSQVGGYADIVSRPGGGTRVTLWVPK